MTQFLLFAWIVCCAHSILPSLMRGQNRLNLIESYKSIPLHCQSLICGLRCAQICSALPLIFCCQYISMLSENKIHISKPSLSKRILDWPLLSNTISWLIRRTWRSCRQLCIVLELQAISSTKISCLLKCWLKWNRSRSGLDSIKLPIKVVWPQLHTCLLKKQMREVTSIIWVKFNLQQHIWKKLVHI